ncbi:MAG: LamG-like jellyroll fold domain-containing protein [Pirellulaceae bacterium]|nr:LamG-like jellyroll fold domain-containing protein [Pirellulaceae bacterium]
MKFPGWLSNKRRSAPHKRRRARRRFAEDFSAQLLVKPLENRLVLSGTPVTMLTLDASGNLVITDTTNHADTLTIKADTTDANSANHKFVITDPNQLLGTSIDGATTSADQHTIEVLFSAVTGDQISVNTAGGNDSLTLDFSLGNFGKQISYDGGNPTTGPGDSLSLTGGGTFGSIAHTFTNASTGTIGISGNGLISYTGLEPITDNLGATNRVFTFNGGAETVTLVDAAGSAMTIDSTLGESVTFANPTSSLTVNLGTGNDTLTISSVDAAYGASLAIHGDAGTDTVNLNADINFASGSSLTVNSETVAVGASANLKAAGTGTVSITATNTTLAAGASLETAGQSLAVTTDDLSLASTAALNSTAAGTVTIKQQTAGTLINLGTTADTLGNGILELSSAELGLVTAATLNIGDSGSGNLTLTAATSTTNKDLNLVTGGNVALGAFALNVSASRNLSITTGFAGSITSNNTTTDITASALTLSAGSGGIFGSTSAGPVFTPLRLAVGSLSSSTSGNANQYLLVATANIAALSAGTGTIRLDGGTFRLTSNNQINDNTFLDINGATLDIQTFTEQVAGVTLTTGTIIGTGATSVLTSTSDFDFKAASANVTARLGGNVGLNKSTAGSVTLANATNSYTGPTRITAGTLIVSTDGNLGQAPATPTAAHLVLDGGTLQTSASFTLNANRGLALGPAAAAGTGTINVATGTLTYDGIIANNAAGTGSLVKSGTGTLSLSGTSTFSGSTSITGGTLAIASDANLGAAPASATPGHLVISGGTLQTTGNFALNANRGLALGPTGASGTGIINVASGTLTYAGIIANNTGGTGALTVSGAGTLSLTGLNTYTGITTILGVLEVTSLDNGGTASGVGASSSAATSLVLGGATAGTLRYTGSTASTDRLFTIANAAATLDASGTGPLSFTNTGTIAISGGTVHTLTLTGTNTGENSFAPILANGAGATSLVKANSGTWALTAANTYTGSTSVSTGTLLIHGSTSATSAVSVATGATLGGTSNPPATAKIGGATTVNGNLVPGSSAGTLNTANVSFAATSTLAVEIGGNTPGAYDQLNVAGTVTVTSGAKLTFASVGGYQPQIGDVYVLINNDGTDPISVPFRDASGNVLAEGALINDFLGTTKTAVVSYLGVGGTGNDLVLTIQSGKTTTVELVGGDLVITDVLGASTADNLTIKSDGTYYIVSDPVSRFATTIPGAIGDDTREIKVLISAVTGSIIFDTQGGNDSLTVDLSLGDFALAPGKSIQYLGGAPTIAPGDSLTIVGGARSFATVSHTLISANSGTIDITGNSQIQYSQLEPVTDNLSATDRVFSFTGGSETIQLTSPAAGTLKLTSTLAESVTFANPTASLTIHAGTGDDSVTLTSVGTFAGQLTVHGDEGNDTINAAALALGVTLTGGIGTDILTGGTGDDVLSGGADNDTLTGGTGLDRLVESFAGTATLTNTSFSGNGTDTLATLEAATLTGSAGSDTLILAVTTAWSLLLDGGGQPLGGGDTLTGPNATFNWDVDAGTAANVGSTITASFSNFETLQGGTGIDTFSLSSAATANLRGGAGNDIFIIDATLTGLIAGEASTGTGDTLQGTAINSVALVGTASDGTEADITGGFTGIETITGNGGTLTGLNATSSWNLAAAPTYVSGATLNFSGFATLQGGTGDDTFNLSAASTFNLDGGTGSDTLSRSLTTAATWNLTSLGGGTVTSLTGSFGGIESLTGSTGNDSFVFQTGGAISGTITGGGTGIDDLDFSNLATSITATLGGSAILTGGGTLAGNIQQVENLTGGSAGDFLTGDGNANTLRGGGGGDTLNGGAGIDSLFGDAGDDLLTGGAGSDTIEGGADSDSLVETFSGTSSLTDLQYKANTTDTDTLASGTLEKAILTGSTGTDTFTMNLTGGNFTGLVTIDAVSGTDTLLGPSAGATWTIATSKLTNANTNVTFANFDTLRGQAGSDNFLVDVAFAGTLDGGASPGTDTLQGSQIDAVVITTGDTANGFDGTESSLAGFENFEVIVGNGSGSLTGDDVASTWNVSATPTYIINAGGASLSFSGFTTLTGGTNADVFNITADQGITTISGGSGTDDINVNASLMFTGSTALSLTAETIDFGAVTITSAAGNQSYAGALSLAGTTLSTTAGGTILLGGNVTVGGTAATTISGQLSLNGATRTFTVADATTSIAADLTISAAISGSAGNGLTKAGAGTLVLSGANTYSGATTLSAGVTAINGSTAAASAVTLAAGATLAGTGTIGGSATISGTVSPGQPTVATTDPASLGILTILGNVTFNVGSFFVAQVNGDLTPGTDYDQLSVGGATINLGNAELVTSGTIPAVSANAVVLIDKTSLGLATNTFNGLPEGATVNIFNGISTVAFRLTYKGGNGNDVVLGADTNVSVKMDENNNLVISDVTNTTNDTLTIYSDIANGRFIITDANPGRILTTNLGNPLTNGNGTNTIYVLFSDVTAAVGLRVETGAGNDSVTFDFSLGNFILPDGSAPLPILYDGGDPIVGPGDVLAVTGNLAAFDKVTHNFTSSSTGTIVIDAASIPEISGAYQLVIDYLGLEPITDNLSAVNREFNFTAVGNKTILLQDAVGAGNNVISSSASETVTFANPTTSLVVHAGAGNDSVTVNTLDAALSPLVDLQIHGDGGTNTLTVGTTDGAIADPLFAFAGFTFSEAVTPDVVTRLDVGTPPGGDGIAITAFPGGATNNAVNFPLAPTAGFDQTLTIGRQLDPSKVSGAYPINLPSGNVGTVVRSGVELGWSNAANHLSNSAGDDFVIYESANGSTAPDGFIVQVHRAGDAAHVWSQWRFESADAFQAYVGSPASGPGAFATAFDLSDFVIGGVNLAAGDQIDGLRIASLTAADRIDAPGTETTIGSGAFSGQGNVLLGDAGVQSDTFPDPGPLASFDFFGNATFDPDLLYVAALHPPTGTRADVIVVESNTVAIETESVTKPTVEHFGFGTLNVNSFGGIDDITVNLGDGALPTTINVNGGDPATADQLTVRGSLSVADDFSLEANAIVESQSGRTITLAAVEKLTLDLAGDNLDDLATIERNFTLAGVNPRISVEGDGAPLDRLVVNVESAFTPVASQDFEISGFTGSLEYVFDQASTPDVLVHLTEGPAPGNPVPDGFGALVDSKAFATSSSALAPVAQPGNLTPFDGDLSIGGLSAQTNGATVARLLNMPSGNVGTTNRSVFQLTWTGNRTLANETGDDFVIFESGTVNAPEAYMVQVHRTDSQTNNGWSEWVYLPAEAFNSAQSTFATSFDLSDFGVPDGQTIDAIRIANLIAADRMSTNPATPNVVIPEDNGATSTILPNPGGLASFTSYGNATLDPDPIYLGVLHSLVLPPPDGVSDSVAIDGDSVVVQGFIPIDYAGLERVTLNTGGGDDRILATPNADTAYSINGQNPNLPAEPGDRLEFDLTGTTGALLTITDPGTGTLTTAGLRNIDVTSIDTFGLPNKDTTATFDLAIDADSATGTRRDDATADPFLVRRNDQTTEVSVDGNIVFRGDRAAIGTATITGSSDSDTLTVDFSRGDPIPAGKLNFLGQGGANQLLLQNGSFQTITHSFTGATTGDIDLDQPVSDNNGPPVSALSSIHYEGLNVETLDDLAAQNRVFHFAAAGNDIRLTDDAAASDGKSHLLDRVVAPRTFADLRFVDPTKTLVVNTGAGNDYFTLEAVDLGYRADTTVNGQTGNDTFLIDDDGRDGSGDPGLGSVDFVVFPIAIHGGGDAADKLIVNDTRDTTGDRFSITESTIGGENLPPGAALNQGTPGTPDFSQIPASFDSGARPPQALQNLLHWTFEEGSGRTTLDLSGLGNDGVLFTPSGPQFVAGGQIGGALQFDGVDDYATFVVPDDPAYDFGTAGTFSFWIQFAPGATTQRNAILNSSDSFPGNGIEFEYRNNSGGEFFAYLNKTLADGVAGADNSLIVQNGALSADFVADPTWYNVQYTWDNNALGGPQARIYVDGTPVALNATFDQTVDLWTQVLDTTGVTFQLGRHRTDTTRFFEGKLDEVAIFNTALSTTQLNAVRNDGMAAAQLALHAELDAVADGGNLVAFWSLDNAPGTVAAPGEAGSSIVVLHIGNPTEGASFAPGGGPTLPGTAVVLDAVDFDGDRDSVVAADSPSLDFDKSQGTISFWINPRGETVRNTLLANSSTLVEDTNQQIEVGISWRDDANSALSHADQYGRIFFSPHQNFPNDSSNVIVSNTRVPLNTWTHVVITWNFGGGVDPEAHIYINGQEDGYLLNTLPEQWTSPAGNTGDWVFGDDAAASPLPRSFDGQMADIAVFGNALTPELVQDYFQNGVPSTFSGLTPIQNPQDLAGASAKFGWDATTLYGQINAYPAGMGSENGPFNDLTVELYKSDGSLLLVFDLTSGYITPSSGSTGTYEFAVPFADLAGFDPNSTDFLQYRIIAQDADVPGAGFDSQLTTLGYVTPPLAGPTAGLGKLNFTHAETLFGGSGRIAYTGLADLQIDTGSGADIVTIYDEPTTSPGASPASTFLLQTGGGNDQITITSIDANYRAQTTILAGQGGTNSIEVFPGLTLGSAVSTGSLYLQADDVTIHGAIDTNTTNTHPSGPGTVTFEVAHKLVLDEAADILSRGVVEQIGSTATIETAAEITTTGDRIEFDGIAKLSGDVELNNGTGSAGNIIFRQTVDSLAATPFDLTMQAHTSDVLVSGAVGATFALDKLTIMTADDVTFSSTLRTASDVTQLAGTGLTSFNGTSGTGVGGSLAVTTRSAGFSTTGFDVFGTVSVNTQQEIAFHSAANLTAGLEILFQVNQDNSGSEGFTQHTTSTIQSASNAANALVIDVKGAGSAAISILKVGTTSGGITLDVGGEISDNHSGEIPGTDANLVGFAATLNAITGIGKTNDIDTELAYVNAFTSDGNPLTTDNDFSLDEATSILLGNVLAPRGSVFVNAGGVIAIEDGKQLQSFTGRVSNAPPLLVVTETNPDDVILPGDPTQEIEVVIGGDLNLGGGPANQEFGENFTIIVKWDDGKVSVLNLLDIGQPDGLKVGDRFRWTVGEDGETTATLVENFAPPADGKVRVIIERTYPLLYLSQITTTELVATVTVQNDTVLPTPLVSNPYAREGHIILTDSLGVDLNSVTASVSTALSEDLFHPPINTTTELPALVISEPARAALAQVNVPPPFTVNIYQNLALSGERNEQELAVLYLVRVAADGTETNRTLLPLSDLRDLAGLLEKLKKAQIPSGLYRIYHQEPGLPPRKVLEFRKTGGSIGDPVREPGRGTNPLDAQPAPGANPTPAPGNADPAPANPAPPPNPEGGAAVVPASLESVALALAEATDESFTRAARLLRRCRV